MAAKTQASFCHCDLIYAPRCPGSNMSGGNLCTQGAVHTRPTLAGFWRGRTGEGGRSDLEVVGFFVQRGDQAVDAVGAQDGGEFRSPRRQFADRSG
jgi:hypothetical protein